ncbi:hypothetical protein KQX54_013983 [Cotesia glomerata]|uniref:Uncharacterized protein n=1 Tax=Cotesia glomerata TaxID=32391 RepID=A0AAV7I0V0_COTGL|nr:hypothetical protein KQX54_013983 [Cotesia glomerata]
MSGPHSSTLAPVFSLPPPLRPGVFPSPPVVQGNSLGLMEGGREFPGVLRWVLGGLYWEIKYHPPSLRSLACVAILSNTDKLSTSIDLGYLGSIMAFSSTTKVLAMSREFDPSFVTVRTLYELLLWQIPCYLKNYDYFPFYPATLHYRGSAISAIQ